jgi:hypothetical protein
MCSVSETEQPAADGQQPDDDRADLPWRWVRVVGEELPAWRRRTAGEHRLPAALAVIVLIALQVSLPLELAFRPWWLLPAIDAVLAVLLVLANPGRITRESRVLRIVALGLVSAATVAIVFTAVRLAYGLVTGSAGNDATELLINAGTVWLTNVIVFALWYWEFDRGGPAARAHGRRPYPDFLFPQMTEKELAPRDWSRRSSTTCTCRSPTRPRSARPTRCPCRGGRSWPCSCSRPVR